MRSIEAMMPAVPNSALWMRRFARVVARTYLVKRPEAVELAAAALALFGVASSPERSAIELLEPAKPPLQDALAPWYGEAGSRGRGLDQMISVSHPSDMPKPKPKPKLA